MQMTKSQENEFDNRMKQYIGEFKARKGENGIWGVLCQNGGVEPFGQDTLCCYQNFKSARGLNLLKGKLPEYCQITQEAQSEIIFKFPNDKFYEVAALAGARRRKRISEIQKATLRENSVKYGFKPKEAA